MHSPVQGPDLTLLAENFASSRYFLIDALDGRVVRHRTYAPRHRAGSARPTNHWSCGELLGNLLATLKGEVFCFNQFRNHLVKSANSKQTDWMAAQAGEVAQAELQVEGGEQAAAEHHLTAKAIANRRRVALEAKLGF